MHTLSMLTFIYLILYVTSHNCSMLTISFILICANLCVLMLTVGMLPQYAKGIILFNINISKARLAHSPFCSVAKH